MFKKKPTIKPAAPLRSSDRRKLADRIISDYELERVDTDLSETDKAAARTALRNSLLPENTQSARFTQLVGPELRQVSGTVYIGAEGSRVLWFELENRLYPSVYSLWRNADLIALLHTPPVVIEKIKGGADLMQPGLAGGPPFPSRARQNAIAAVASTSNPSVPVAVGVCVVDINSLSSVQGTKGRAVDILHWAGDELWSFSVQGKAGAPTPVQLGGWLGHLSLDEDEDGLPDGEEGVKLAVPIEQDATETSSMTDTPRQPRTQKEIDEAFRAAFLYGVYHHKASYSKESRYGMTFPISQSWIQSNLVNPFLPNFDTRDKAELQMKKTSWKNIKKFVKSLDKDKVVKSKEKDGHECVILDIDFEDAAILNFKPYRLPNKETAPKTHEGPVEDENDSSIGQKLRIATFYRPTARLEPLFDPGKQTYTSTEVRERISTYIEKENLVSESSNKRLVKLDPTLANAVFDGSGSVDREVLAKGVAPRDAIIDRLLGAMHTSYTISRNGEAESKAKPGSPSKILITLETRSGNKTVTKVSGLEAYHIDSRLLADELRRTVAASTSVEALAGAAKKHEKESTEMMIQGPQKDALVKALEKRGVDRKWIEVNDKTKKKK